MNEKVTILSADSFDQKLAGTDKPVLVDFWAAWCGPCKMLLPIIDALAEDNFGKAEICKVNVDDAEELSSGLGVDTIPTVIIYKGGVEVERSVGFRQKAQLQALLDKYL